MPSRRPLPPARAKGSACRAAAASSPYSPKTAVITDTYRRGRTDRILAVTAVKRGVRSGCRHRSSDAGRAGPPRVPPRPGDILARAASLRARRRRGSSEAEQLIRNQ